jgi:tRNA A-37 threonylcarbamoyl transferase component Bud32
MFEVPGKNRVVDRLVGQVVFNYRVVDLLGQGGFGRVFRARHVDLGREVAIKVLLPQHQDRPDLIERFLREARLVCEIGHPDIVTVENAGQLEDETPFYIMELVDGRSLSAFVAEAGSLSADRFGQVFEPLARALSVAHARGIVHRDLKPQNVMVRGQGEEIRGIKLLDFGIAKVLHVPGADSASGSVLGSLHYMAPEQALDSKHVDQRADVYAFAATAYFALTGRRPFAADNTPELLHRVLHDHPLPVHVVAPHLPTGLWSAMRRSLSKHPEDRPDSVAEAYELLRHALAMGWPGPSALDPATRALARPASSGARPSVTMTCATPPDGGSSSNSALVGEKRAGLVSPRGWGWRRASAALAGFVAFVVLAVAVPRIVASGQKPVPLAPALATHLPAEPALMAGMDAGVVPAPAAPVPVVANETRPAPAAKPAKRVRRDVSTRAAPVPDAGIEPAAAGPAPPTVLAPAVADDRIVPDSPYKLRAKHP